MPFFENRKKCPNFGEKSADCAHSWPKLSTQNVVLRVSRRKNFKNLFLSGLLFLYFRRNIDRSDLIPQNFSCLEIFSVAQLVF